MHQMMVTSKPVQKSSSDSEKQTGGSKKPVDWCRSTCTATLDMTEANAQAQRLSLARRPTGLIYAWPPFAATLKSFPMLKIVSSAGGPTLLG
jgi:hypothetical protein